MRSSSNQPELPRDSALSDAGAWLLVIAIALVPLFWLPVFHTGFETPRVALTLVVIAPLAALLLSRNWAQRAFARVPVSCVILVIAAGLMPHLLGTFDVHTAWRSLRFLAPLAALILGGAALMHPAFYPRLELALVVPAIPVLAIGLLRRHANVFDFLPDRVDVAISSTLGNSNALGEAFAPVFLAGLVFAPAAVTRFRSVLLWAGTACALVLVAISHSRGAVLATAAGLAAYGALWLRDRRDDSKARSLALRGVLVAAAAVGIFIALPAAAGARDWIRSFVSTTAPTNVVRLSVWGGTVELVKETMPMGAGLGRFEAAFLPHRRADEWDLSGPDTRVDNPHQEFLWVLSETGVLGLAALLLLFVVALRRATRPDDGLPDWMKRPQRALLLATVALVVLSLVRAPLHHPSGVLVFATLLGCVAPRTLVATKGRFDLAVVPLLGAFATLALLDAREDVLVGHARAALSAGNAAVLRGDRDHATELLRDSGRRLKEVPAAILKDFDRSYRSALAAEELANVHEALSQIAPEKAADLTTHEDVRILLEETLRLFPNHPGATTRLALLWLKQGSVAHAETLWKEAIAALPNAPRFRHNLASLYQRNDRFADAIRWMEEEVARHPSPSREEQAWLAALGLGLGRDEATFGRYLGPPGDGIPSPAGDAPAGETSPRERRIAALLRLSRNPGDGATLAELAAADFALGLEMIDDLDIPAEANRALARSRVRFAVEMVATGDLPQAEIFLKQSVQRDPALIDAWFLRAKVAARMERDADVLDHLRAIKERGVRIETLRAWVQADADLGASLAAGKLSPLGL